VRYVILCLLAAGCNDYRTQTRAFVATTPCGQGPYDITVPVDGKTGAEGIEVIACTSHRLVGHVEVTANGMPFRTEAFGYVADNARCMAGQPTIVATQAAAGDGGGSAGAAGPGSRAAAPALVERPYYGKETPFGDELCKSYGLGSQTLYGQTTTNTEVLHAGMTMRVRIWSDAPNDLENVVFMVRHVLSKKSLAEVKKDEAEELREAEKHPVKESDLPPPPPPSHGPPPAPLAEQQPPAPIAGATWTPGYWTWTGNAWGWIAGFWRDDRVAMPAPRVEMPGAPPAPMAVWIGGAWTLRGGSWIWVRGRWR